MSYATASNPAAVQSGSSLTGLFHTEEKCIVFLDIVQELMNSTLMDAYRSAANLKFHEIPSVLHFSPYIAERFRYALDLIPNWPYQILQQEEERALQRCSAIYECYRYLVEAYAKELGGGGGSSLYSNVTQNLPLPPLPAFLHDIYNEFICIPEVRNGVYFQMYGIHRKSTIADAIRSALRKLVSKLIDVGGTHHNNHNGYPAAAAPYLSPGPSISQRVASHGLPPQQVSPQAPPQPPQLLPPPKHSIASLPATPKTGAPPSFPDFPQTPKTQKPPQPPSLPATPATQKSSRPLVPKTPFQRAIEIDMNAVPSTPGNSHTEDDSEE